ncbi:KilA-N domain-containing protein [Tolypothrix sp. VBCCA 56010]|uniref:KilA-N domain-containing protein n=1 Tax=Tolypothrix sp. VBCCA 56010 TaxID=3137731 RepID=UPI003D7E0FC5
MTDLTLFDYEGYPIRREPSNPDLICLTDMWKATGSHPSKDVDSWLNIDQATELLVELMIQLNTPNAGVFKTSKPGFSRKDRRALERWISNVRQAAKEAGIIRSSVGRTGGTYAIPKLAIAYAKYLSTKFHIQVLDTMERIGKRDVTLTAELIDRHSPEQQTWLLNRQLAAKSHNALKGEILNHGSNGGHILSWFPQINTLAVTGLLPKEIKKRLGVKTAADGMTDEELAHLASLQYLQSREIKRRGCDGDTQIKSAIADTAQNHAQYLNQYQLPEEQEKPTNLLDRIKAGIGRLLKGA